jgi:hypothetical protein
MNEVTKPKLMVKVMLKRYGPGKDPEKDEPDEIIVSEHELQPSKTTAE